jgi:hypothetical protein
LYFNLLQQDVLLEVIVRFYLYLYNEEILTGQVVSLWVDGALQHLKLSLGTQINSLINKIGPIFESGRHVSHVHEIGYVSFINLVLVLFQCLVMVVQPSVHVWSDEQIVLFMGRGVKIQSTMSIPKVVFVVNEHYLSVTIWVSQW